MEPRNEDINAKKIISVEDAITKLGKARLEVFRPARIRTLTSAPEGGGGGGYTWEFLVGVCRRVLKILTLFQNKKCHFPDPFSDLAFRQKLC